MGVYSGNRTFLSESDFDTNQSSHIMDFVIESERNDLHMFEAVINCDFIEAYNEAGIIALTEDQKEEAKDKTKKGIAQKIKELFKKAIAAVNNFIASWVAKIKNLLANDAKLVKKYIKSFESNWSKVKISGWRPIIENYGEYDAIAVKVYQAYDSTNKNIDSAATADAINEAIKKGKEEYKNIDYSKIALDAFFKGEKDKNEEGHTLSEDEMRAIKKVMTDNNKALNTIKEAGKRSIKKLKDTESSLKYDKYSSDHDDISLAKINAKYNWAKTSIGYYSKMLNAVVNVYGRYIAQCRKAFVLAGKKGSPAEDSNNAGQTTNDNEQVTNDAFDFMLGEASDIYVESVLFSD